MIWIWKLLFRSFDLVDRTVPVRPLWPACTEMPSEGKSWGNGPAKPHYSVWKSDRSLITCWLPEKGGDRNSNTPRMRARDGTRYLRRLAGRSDHLDPPVVGLVGIVWFNMIYSG